jgi:5-oxoprolinase (ATP-hydrolysing)
VVDPAPWQLWIDTGGTFTDCLARHPDGELRRAKVLSSSALRTRIERLNGPRNVTLGSGWDLPDDFFVGATFRVLAKPVVAAEVTGFDPESGVVRLAEDLPAGVEAGGRCELAASVEAPVLAAHVVTRTPLGAQLPPIAARLASTRGTNALLERRGAPTAFFVTRGLGDLLTIGTQQRPDLFTLEIVKPVPLYRAVVEVTERLAADGTVLEPIDTDQLRTRLEALVAEGVRCAAVALLHSWCNPDHERILAGALREAGFDHVSCSADLAPLIRLLPRAQTAVVDAYLAPIIGDYLAEVAGAIPDGSLQVMTSAGGLVGVDGVRPKDTLLSGPAGGVVGAAAAARESACQRAISFDMGGTSTDVARWDGEFEYLFEHRVGEAQLMAPALAVETVAAGGGSVCRVDGEALTVGPDSAGARPGPACYGAGGPLTLTDLNLLLGRIDTDRFQIPVDTEAAAAALATVRDELCRTRGEEIPSEALAEGFLRIADERMAAAIRRISLRRGYDPAAYPLVAFGGAGPQHACAVASLLDIATVLVPRDASLLSALGVGAAVVERFSQLQLLGALDEVAGRLAAMYDRLDDQARSEVVREGVPADRVVIRRRIAHLRLAGQDSTLEVGWHSGIDLQTRFEECYRQLYGYAPPPRQIEVESLRVVASMAPDAVEVPASLDGAEIAEPVGGRQVVFDGRRVGAAIFDRDRLRPGARLSGPALVTELHSVTVVPPDWQLVVDAAGALRLTRCADQSRDLDLASSAGRPANRRLSGRGTPAIGNTAAGASDAVQLELFSNRFEAIARDMGALLSRCALSTNVKERMDFSCAVLDAEGRLVVNAPHIPVHLGALGLCVRRLLGELEFTPGDTVITNHPAYGGSHLPDVTAVTPAFDADRLLGFVANRAHHAEIGGRRPGSVPPDARCLAEEGVVIPPTYLVRRGEPQWQTVTRMLAGAPYPSRAIQDNLADLEAAVAANRLGAVALTELANKHGAHSMIAHMAAIAGRAASLVGDALERFEDGVYTAEERLDDGSPLRVAVHIVGRRAVVDFSGSADIHPGNLNATPAVVRAAVLYVLRLLIAEPVPLNEGLMEAVELVLPPGMLNPRFPADPRQAPAVVGGNVETSQRLVDVLLKALDLVACSQGTMNNVIFGAEDFGYYETVAGGTGAGPTFRGADAVHSHMTNTRATDPELLEHRYPVRLHRFTVRRGSGGRGRFRGGDGAVRELEFLRPVSLSLLAQHRAEGPYGRRGGEAGRPGRQTVVRAGGVELELAGIDSCELACGDRLILETPGGGGWGEPEREF